MEFEMKQEAMRKLADYYNIRDFNAIPLTREKSKWTDENKFGFFRGIIDHSSVDAHITELNRLLTEDLLRSQDQFSKPTENNTFIDDMYTFYILPFKQHNGQTGSCSSLGSSSGNSSLVGSPSSLRRDPLQPKPLTHRSFKRALEKRDKVCLFCWEQ
jgi:hypothetical protein